MNIQSNKKSRSYHQRHSGGITGKLLLSNIRMQGVSKTEPLNQSNHWFSIILFKLSIRGENGPSQDEKYIIQNLQNVLE